MLGLSSTLETRWIELLWLNIFFEGETELRARWEDEYENGPTLSLLHVDIEGPDLAILLASRTKMRP